MDLSNAAWRKSSRSQGANACIEMADNLPGVVPVRDSKDPSGPALVVKRAAFVAAINAIRSGHLA